MRICFVLIVVALGSCSVQETRFRTSNISYESETFQRSSKGCPSDTSGCARYEISFPVFSGLDSATQNIIRQRIQEVAAMGNPEAAGWTIRESGENFISSFEKLQQEGPEITGGNWHYEANAEVLLLMDTLISLQISEEFYTGGAHGGTGTYFVNVRPGLAREIKLTDIFKPGYERVLLIEGERSFREARELSDTTAYRNAGFEFPNNEFTLNDNFGFTEDAIVFVFNSYEIAPYALGPTRISIPFKRLSQWLKSND